jgi:prepilin-type N-terminal cleavage/methylation domain-containing protein/prepilin-type processing-associated H-X9-DG protein
MARLSTRQGAYRQRGFTLVELLIVLAVIALLISILLPSLSMAKEYAYDAQCKSNMHRLADVMRTAGPSKPAGNLPSAQGWISFVTGQEAAGLLKCPKDDRKHGELQEDSVLDDVYITQVSGGTKFSYLKDIFAGRDLDDQQILLNPKPTSHQGDHCFCSNWYPFAQRSRKSNENIITADDDAAVLITEKEDGWEFQSLDPEGDTHCGSDHWLCKGDAGDDWRTEILMRLTGDNYRNIVDEAVFLEGGGVTSYGMNNQVPARPGRGSQVLLTEYQRSVVNVDENSDNVIDDFMNTEEYLAPRHFAERELANTAFADGSVRALSPFDLDPENQPEETDIWKP